MSDKWGCNDTLQRLKGTLERKFLACFSIANVYGLSIFKSQIPEKLDQPIITISMLLFIYINMSKVKPRILSGISY